MKKLILFLFVSYCYAGYSQTADTAKEEAWQKIYRAAATKINDLVNTKLEVKFDYSKSWMYGKAWITLHPHFYPTDSLNLDAKGMDIKEVSVVKAGKNIPLKYAYDSSNLFITLDKTYLGGENYIVYINYISRPNSLKIKGSMAITDAKGLYFINPLGEDKNKPIQIWTQGETEANSAWFPTIDKPNQKTTEEISMTVPAKYVTLSNGNLVSKKSNTDGTRTDTWKMNLPHAPYLFFMGVGDFAIIKDSYKGKEVSYYVEKEYAKVARKIFGLTPQMIAFYSKITGVDFPWPKYAQMAGRDYVSGAMENTTSTLHGEVAQQDARELKDDNRWEGVIAHELFHQWFGDYVTAESWSNITLNESFADYSETLWNEYKYGKDEGDAKINADLRSYLSNPENARKNLVRFYYADKEDVFDGVSYPKGGCILHMLRNYVGERAFFKSLNVYLTAHKFQSAEAQQLRLAFEQVTGQDLNWFWNQWYYGSGHPKLDISYSYDAAGKTAKVFIQQTQSNKVFSLPFVIDVYEGGSKKRYKVWMKQPTDTFSFAANVKPDLINVDGDKILLCEKTDRKPLEDFIYQYAHAGLYRDRREAIVFAAQNQKDKKALDFLKSALRDQSPRLRLLVLDSLHMSNDTVKKSLESVLENMAKTDAKAWVRAKAIELLGNYKKAVYKPLFMSAVTDSSYSVAGTALEALVKIDSTAAMNEIKRIAAQPAKGELRNVLIRYADEKSFDSLAAQFDKLAFGSSKLAMLPPFSDFLSRVKNTENLKKGVDIIVKFRNDIPQQYHSWSDDFLNYSLNGIAEKKQAAGLTEQAAYVKSKLPAQKK